MGHSKMTKEKKVKGNQNIKKKANQNQVSIVNSITGRIIALAFAAIVLTVAIMLIRIIPVVQSTLTEQNQNYLLDLAETSGQTIDDQISYLGEYRVMNAMSLQKAIGDVGISGMESSYTYVFDPAGVFLYHPNLDMVGQPVEIEAANLLLTEISNGNRPEAALIEYDYNGEHKYAAYYVGVQMNYVLMVTADEAELLSRVQEVIIDAVVGAAVAFILSILLALFVSQRIVRPIKEISGQVLRLGNLDFKKDKKLEKLAARKDEAGIMAKAVKQLQEQLENILREMKNQFQQLYNASGVMSTSAQESNASVHQVETAVSDIASGATSQAKETHVAMENVVLMGNMIEENGKEVNSLRENIIQMGEHGNHALQILTELEQINQKTKAAINEISEQTYQTNKSALEIKQVTTLIADIAEETNLLSLNASIEAARAGEHGRGFAVVASQIQKLAEQSNESAKQIDSIINLLISASDRSVETMKEVNIVVDKQNENVALTEQAFESVKQGIDRSITGIDAIADHTQRMDHARVKVVDVVHNLTAFAQENAASAEQTSVAVTEVGAIINNVADNAGYLIEIANKLDENVNLFQVDGD